MQDKARLYIKYFFQQEANHVYLQTSNISRTWTGYKLVNYWYVGHCFNYIFILDLTPGFNGLGKEYYKTRRDTFKFWDFVWFILEVLR